jgi:hypothetical protein
VDTAKSAGPPGDETDPESGYPYLHHAVDDHSRLAYSQVLCDQMKEITPGSGPERTTSS